MLPFIDWLSVCTKLIKGIFSTMTNNLIEEAQSLIAWAMVEGEEMGLVDSAIWQALNGLFEITYLLEKQNKTVVRLDS